LGRSRAELTTKTNAGGAALYLRWCGATGKGDCRTPRRRHLVATYRQLARWTKKGMIKRVRTGRYAAVALKTTPLRDLQKR
jgi:hypothetical protein